MVFVRRFPLTGFSKDISGLVNGEQSALFNQVSRLALVQEQCDQPTGWQLGGSPIRANIKMGSSAKHTDLPSKKFKCTNRRARLASVPSEAPFDDQLQFIQNGFLRYVHLAITLANLTFQFREFSL